MANHRLTTDWANRRNVVYVCDAGIYRVSPTQTEKLSVHRFGGRLDTRSVRVGDTFPVD